MFRGNKKGGSQSAVGSQGRKVESVLLRKAERRSGSNRLRQRDVGGDRQSNGTRAPTQMNYAEARLSLYAHLPPRGTHRLRINIEALYRKRWTIKEL